MDPTPENGVWFYPSGVCSKWGFNDGDLLFDLVYDELLPPGATENAVLVAAVREFVAPLFGDRVELYEIGGIHNPIRAARIDGTDWDAYAPNAPEWIDALPPVWVTVDQLRELARLLTPDTRNEDTK